MALVTGAARGLGLAIARVLWGQGATVFLCDVDEDEGRRAAASLGERAHFIPLDVSDLEAVRRAVSEIQERTGGPHVLVNNAGVLYSTRLPDIPEAEWQHTFAVNVHGVFHCTQAVVDIMRDHGWGRVINVSSTAGKTVSTLGGAHYTASKSAVLGFTRAAAHELAPFGITVNAVCPGLVDTDMARRNTTPEQLRSLAARFPVGRVGVPEDVAALVAFLASDQAAYITGAALDINGGDLMI